jgi:hypothetical protein
MCNRVLALQPPSRGPARGQGLLLTGDHMLTCHNVYGRACGLTVMQFSDSTAQQSSLHALQSKAQLCHNSIHALL